MSSFPSSRWWGTGCLPDCMKDTASHQVVRPRLWIPWGADIHIWGRVWGGCSFPETTFICSGIVPSSMPDIFEAWKEFLLVPPPRLFPAVVLAFWLFPPARLFPPAEALVLWGTRCHPADPASHSISDWAGLVLPLEEGLFPIPLILLENAFCMDLATFDFGFADPAARCFWTALSRSSSCSCW